MEHSLDNISEGKEDYLTFLSNFYLGEKGLKHTVEQKTKEISALEFKKVYLNLPENLELRLGKYGPFLHDNQLKQDYSLPEDLTPSDCREETLATWIEKIKKGKEPLGYKNELPIFLLQGPYGPYLQYNSKNISIPKMLHQQTIDLPLALEFLELPKELGLYEGFPIVLQVGPFGPYVKWQQESRSISSKEFLKTTLEQGIELIKKPKGTRRGSVLIKDFELHQRKKLALYQGPYGVYIKWGTKNITIPEELRKEDISLEEIKKLLKE
jgi:DNA topoisomerase-1